MDEEVEAGRVGPEVRQALGVRMRMLRRKAGLRQEDLAARLGVTKRTVGSWERDGLPVGKVARVDAALGGALRDPGSNGGLDTSSHARLDTTAAALEPMAELLDSLLLRVTLLERALEQRVAR